MAAYVNFAIWQPSCNNAALDRNVTVDAVDAGGGTATSGTDYTPIGTQTLTFPSGSPSGTTRTVTLTPNNDLVVEPAETVNLRLQNRFGPASLGTTASTVTIGDDDSATLSIQTSDTATEPGGAQTTQVTLTISGSGTGSLSTAVTADVVDASGGTATSGTDYSTFGTQTVTFPVGAASGTTQSVSLTPTNDLLVETNETVRLSLQNVSGSATLGAVLSTVTISDDDTASLSIQATDSATEAGGSQTTDVSLTLSGSGSGTAALAVAVTADVVDAGGGSASSTDYSALGTQTVTFPVGSTSGTTQNAVLTPLDDLLIEGNETVNLTLQNPGGPATLGATASTVTIVDDDGTPVTVSIQAADTATEPGGAQTTDVVLTFSGVGTLAVPVTVEVVDAGVGTAISGSDYTPIGTQTLTFPVGSPSGTTRTASLTPINDRLVEAGETVKLALQNLTGPATLGTAASTVTITDDETATLSIPATDTASEPGGAQTTAVTLTVAGTGTGAAALIAPVTAEVVDASGGTAISGTDYMALATQTVTFGAGAVSGSSQNVSLTPINDLLVEGAETVASSEESVGEILQRTKERVFRPCF